MKIKKFFGTFMQKQAFKKHYVTIQAYNMSLARDCMFAHFGAEFMTVYEDIDGALKDQVERFNLEELTSIQVIDHAYGSVEYIPIGRIFT